MAFGGPQVGRINAAVQHLGGPKAAPKAPAPKGKPAGRPPPRPAARKPPAAHKAAPAPKKSGGGESLPLSQLSPAQLAHRATKIGQAEQTQALNPLKAQGNEINANQSAVQGAYGGYANSQNTLLQQLQSNQEASAKTAENQAAQNALTAGKAIETSGQAQASQTAGYVSPELKAELNSEGQRALGMNGAGTALTNNLGTNETNYLTNLRASAAQKVLQGQQGIASTYGKQLGGVKTKEGEVIAKGPANIAAKRAEMEKTQFNQKATIAGLTGKTEALNAKVKGEATKAKLTAAQIAQRERANQRSTSTSEANNQRSTATSRANAQEHTRVSQELAKIKASASKASGGGTAGGAGGLTQNETNKAISDITTAYESIHEGRTAKVPSAAIREELTEGKEQRGGKRVTGPKVANGTLITAAFELYNYHRLGKGTIEALGHMGVKVPPELTNGSFKGYVKAKK